ncbi:MAG TPA: Sua5/YciO/YrdC/YwlC family protein [Moraxellaceae bacterium]|nr:Sua5/YciO/YrdC/YwlC family protein [Moraxellaceae bacterium]
MNTPEFSSGSDLQRAVDALRQGQVIAYPTEAVWGLGCDPLNESAVRRVLALKGRSEAKGLILIAAGIDQVEPWLAALTPAQKAAVLATWPGPYTWVVPAPQAPRWLRGEHDSLAIRVSAHPGVQALCRAWGAPLVSTSANRSGEAPLGSPDELHHAFGEGLGFILPGALGGDAKPSEIRDAVTGAVLRAR